MFRKLRDICFLLGDYCFVFFLASNYSEIICFFLLSAEKGVPDFWLIALKNNEITAEEVRLFGYYNSFYEESTLLVLMFYFIFVSHDCR